MFRFTDFKIKDFGGHREVVKKSMGSSLGLVGPNGSGKSTILQAFQLALEGSINHEDALAEFVRTDSTGDAPIKFVTEHGFISNGRRGRIKREVLRSGGVKRELTMDGLEKKLTAAGDVERALREIVGADSKAIRSTVFIPQGSLDKLFAGLDSERRDFYVRLLALGHLEKVADVVEGFRKQVAGSLSDLTAVRDGAADALQQASDYFTSLDEELHRMTAFKREIEFAVGLQNLMTSQDEASEKKTLASSALQQVLLSEGVSAEGAPKWVTETEARVEELKRLAAEAKANWEHRVSLDARKTTAEATVAKMRQWLSNQAEITTKQAEVTKVAEILGRPDPRLQIAKLERWAAARTERTMTGARVQVGESKLPELQKVAEDTKKAYEDARYAHQSTQNLWRETRDLVQKQKQLKKEVDELVECNTNPCCAMCGSKTPDLTYLDTQIAEGERRMAADQVEGAAQAAVMLEAEKAAVAPKKEFDDMSANVRSWNAKLAELDRELAGAPPEKDWAALKAEAESQVAEYAEASAINGRLSREIAELEAKQRGYTCTTENLSQWQDEVRQVAAALEHQRGDAEILRHNHNQLSEELETVRGKLSRVAEAVTTQKTRAAAAGDAALAVGYKIDELASVPVLRAKLQAIGDVVTSEALASVLGELRLAETAYNEQVGKVGAARKSMADADSRLSEIDLRVAEQKNRITLAEELSRLAGAFKPSGVTMDFLDYQFGQIASLTQEHLSEMGADFMVAASESRPLAFEFLRLNKPNEAWLKQSRMSGGQKVRLALAVLLAIHELVIPDVGLLVLDEPSLHLDEDAKLTFGEVIRDLCEAGGEEGRQIIICDHDQRLMSSLPDVMEFGQL